MLKLIAAEKRTLVYFAPTRDFHVLANERIYRRCSPGVERAILI